MALPNIKTVIEMVGGIHDGWRMWTPGGISCIIMPNFYVRGQNELELWVPNVGDDVVRYVEDIERSTTATRKFLFERVITYGTSDI